MKKLALLLGIFFLADSVKSQVTLNAEGAYLNNDGALFSGVLENQENGQRSSVCEIKDGLLNGECKYYDATGKLVEKGKFENGKKHGEWLRYNESGMMVGLALYHEGKKNGTWMVWDDIGKKRFEMHYKMGEKTGTWYNWDENGELLSSKDFSAN